VPSSLAPTTAGAVEASKRPERPTVSVERALPIGALVAVHWVAHRRGPEPDYFDVTNAQQLGLVSSARNQWQATDDGRRALREHGWL
jgi:hypothetical protein